MKMKRILAIFLLPLCVFVSLFLFAAADGEKESPLEEIMYLLTEEYLYPFDPVACREEVRQALISRSRNREKTDCLDAYFGYLSAEAYEERKNEEEKGYFYGIGIAIINSPDGVKIVKVTKKGSADKAGIKTGDIILAVRQEGDKNSVKVTNLRETESIKGPDGTKVWISVKRQGKILVIPVIRSKVELEEVSFKKLKNGILYVALREFSLKKTAEDMRIALKSASPENPRVIIDVRGNPGGYVSSVMEILYDFSEDSRDILITDKYKNREKIWTIDELSLFGFFFHNADFTFKKPGLYRHYRVVVLINKNSASAAEIFSGVLQDWGSKTNRFTVLGETSYGKGIGQTVFMLSDGSAFKMTTFEYLVGNSQTPVHGKGITPNYPVEDSRKDYTDTATSKDRQFMEAIKILEK